MSDVVDNNKHLGAALAFAQRLQQKRDAKLMRSHAFTKREKDRIRERQEACDAPPILSQARRKRASVAAD